MVKDIAVQLGGEVETLLDTVQRRTLAYFWEGAHPASGLAYDRRLIYGEARNDLIAIGASGFSFIAVVIGVHRGWIPRKEGIVHLAKMLVALESARRYHGAFPHFIDGYTGATVPFSRFDDGGDLVETALLLQGMICAREYFAKADDPHEQEIGRRIDAIIDDVDWNWYARGADTTLFWHWSSRHGWRKELPISGWNEALVAYILALGASRNAVEPSVYHSGWARFGQFRNGGVFHDVRLPLGEAFGGPLFLSQLPFSCIDPGAIRDGYADYREQACAHATINYRHCVENATRYAGYGAQCWGLTACHGPKGYLVCSPTNDHGIISPSAALSSFPFLPEEAEAAMRFFLKYKGGKLFGRFGFVDAFSPATGWVARTSLALNQGLTLTMIENHRSRLLWDLFSRSREFQKTRQAIEEVDRGAAA